MLRWLAELEAPAAPFPSTEAPVIWRAEPLPPPSEPEDFEPLRSETLSWRIWWLPIVDIARKESGDVRTTPEASGRFLLLHAREASRGGGYNDDGDNYDILK